MKNPARLIILLILAIVGTLKGNDPAAAVPGRPAFVVDSLRLDASVHDDTLGMPHMTFLILNLTSHFDGKPGALNSIELTTDSMGCGALYSPAGHIPVNLHYSETQAFMFPSAFSGQDSIFVRLTFEGIFWERNRTIDTTYGAFTNRDSAWVRIRR